MLRTQSLGKNLQPAASDFPAAQYIETLIFLSIRPLTSGNRLIFSSRDIGVYPYAPKKSASPLVLPVPLFNPLT